MSRYVCSLWACLGALLLAASIGSGAGAYSWDVPTTGAWDNEDAWDPVREFPSSADLMTIDNGGTCLFSPPGQEEEIVSMLKIQGGSSLIHTAKKLRLFNQLWLGFGNGTGRYSLTGSGASFEADNAFVGFGSTGIFTQSAGDCDIEYLALGCSSSGGSGTYNLSGTTETTLDISSGLTIGDYRLGRFNQSGAVCTVTGRLKLGAMDGSDGKYDLSGGACNVNGDLNIGYHNGASGELEISGGILTVERLWVGFALLSSGTALLDIQDDSDVSINVGEKLRFGNRSRLTVTSGEYPKVHMTGTASAFEIDEDAAGANLNLEQLTLIFQAADSNDVKTIEAAGPAVAADAAPADDTHFNTANFALCGLIIGKAESPEPTYGPDKLQLVNAENNRDGDEALYVETLTIAAGGTFDQASVNNYPLYYLKGEDPNRLFMGDANLDGMVDLLDLIILSNPDNWEQSGKVWAEGDFNGDRWVDLLDLIILANNWERGDPPPGKAGGSGLPKLEDVDGDGDFDIDDVRIILKRWEEEH